MTSSIGPCVTAKFAVVPYGPVELEGFLMPNGEFRQSLNSTARALGMRRTSEHFRDILRQLATGQGSAQANPGTAGDLKENGRKSASGIIEISTGISGVAGKAQTLDLNTVIAFWGHVARSGGKYAMPALELLQIGAKVSLEGSYREAFGITDSRTMQEQLLDAWLDLEQMKRRPLISRNFAEHLLRVTGHNAYGKSNYMRVIISELIWHRIPEEIYNEMMDLNPVTRPCFYKADGTPVGYRQYAHSALLADDAFRDAVRPIAASAEAILSVAPGKEQGGYKWTLDRLDALHPRFKKRGKQPLKNKSQGMLF